MSVCLESSSVLPSQVGKLPEAVQPSQQVQNQNANIIVANAQSIAGAPAIQKVNSSVITVVNTPGPITVVKSIGCATTASHFTLVNSNVKSPPTITLVNAPPITVVKNITETPPSKSEAISSPSNNNGSLPVAPVSEKPTGIHNVFVKKSSPAEGGGISMPDMPQSHKLLTANSFPTSNVIPNLSTGPVLKTANGQRSMSTCNKVKILSNIVMPGSSGNTVPGPSNILLNKSQRYYQQKMVGNGQTKYLSKPPADKRVLYPTHKSQLKTLTAGYKPPQPTCIKALSPGAVQRTGAGLRTIPPQRPSLPNKTNYIGKHAVQAQKMKPKVKTKQQQQQQMIANRGQPQEQSAQMIFNQALTAQILETLSDKESTMGSGKLSSINSYLNTNLKYEPKHESAATLLQKQHEPKEYKPQILSTLDTLSFVCQAVLLDHNYNATLPAEPAPSPQPVPQMPQMNGGNQNQQFSPIPNYPTNVPIVKRSRTISQTVIQREDDVASDISEERKLDTEGEETDTSPEAEAVVANEAGDRYGDYVTRCICGFIHDDGYMIECDGCKVWQHVRCVVRTKKVPDDYLCEACDSSKHPDRQKARALQQQWMREIQERDAKLRKEQMALTDSDSSDGEALKGRRKEPPKRQRKRKERKIPTKRTKSKAPTHGKSDDEKLPQLRQWIENYEEAMTNHYSPELRARLINLHSSNLVTSSEILSYVDPSVCNCKVQNQTPNLKCLVATVSLPLDTPVIEIRGKYMLSTQHRATTRQQRPGPFLFFHRLCREAEVCVDTRSFGNCARFIRRSCTPNAELQHYLEKNTVHLYIVTTKSVDKGHELTIRHESHDLAAAHITEIPCACINPEYCALTKTHRRNNGDASMEGRKRRGRHSREAPTLTTPTTQTNALSEPETEVIPVKTEKNECVDEIKDVEDEEDIVKNTQSEEKLLEAEIIEKIKEEPQEAEVVEDVIIKAEIKKEEIEIKQEVEEEKKEVAKEESEDDNEVETLKVETKVEAAIKDEKVVAGGDDEEEEDEAISESAPLAPPPPVITRRASRHAQDQQTQEDPIVSAEQEKKGKEKLSREDRKLQAIMKAIERMERQEQRKQEHQAKQAHRRESEPSVMNTTTPHKEEPPRAKRRKRKGRARTISTNSRRNRLDSADSMHSSDDTLLSPPPSESSSPSKAAGLLLALANGDVSRKSPDRMMDSNSNSAHSSPETPLSSACLLVAAAVEPLEPGFKFPKTKKVLMNEWLNKSDVVQSASAISPSSLQPHLENNYFTPGKNLNALAQAASLYDQPRTGSAKKRWLRQAISEDQCDSPPPSLDAVGPPKKRRLPRESLSAEASPPLTPTSTAPPSQVEIITHTEGDSPTHMESEATLNELAIEMRQEYGTCISLPMQEPPKIDALPPAEEQIVIPVPSPMEIPIQLTPPIPRGLHLDPRLARFSNSDQLVGTVEKTLSFLGFEETKKPEAITPAKRKLSITEYRQRKKLNNNEKSLTDDISINDESNSSQSPKLPRTRSNSLSSVTSGGSTDDDIAPTTTIVPEVKALSAFNCEPTELERQRESGSLRLKKAFGLAVDDMKKITPLNVDTILKSEINLSVPIKSSLPLSSPSFPIPGSAEPQESMQEAPILMKSHSRFELSPAPDAGSTHLTCDLTSELIDEVDDNDEGLEEEEEPDPSSDGELENVDDAHVSAAVEEDDEIGSYPSEDVAEEQGETVMFYTPDDEEMTESTSYVPPFNNPLYPNTNYATYGSVIDDDVPYEGRNPSPPPDLGRVP